MPLRLALLFIVILSGCGGGGGGGPNAERVASTAAEQLIRHFRIVNVVGQDSVNRDEALAIFQWARTAAGGLGMTWELDSYREVPAADIPIDLYAFDQGLQLQRHDALRRHAREHGCLGAGVCFYMLPPMLDGAGKRYIGGVGDSGCLQEAFAFGQAERLSTQNPPRDRLYGSAMILAHETTHGLGEGHRNVSEGYEPNIMDEAPGRFVDEYFGVLPFVAETRQIALECAAGRSISLAAGEIFPELE